MIYDVEHGIDTDRPWNLRHIIRAASETRGKHEMVHNKRPRLRICALNLYRPFLRFWVLRGPRDRGGGPYIQV